MIDHFSYANYTIGKSERDMLNLILEFFEGEYFYGKNPLKMTPKEWQHCLDWDEPQITAFINIWKEFGGNK